MAAVATGTFATKEGARDGAEGGLRGHWESRGGLNAEASQGGAVCAKLHRLYPILCFREVRKRAFPFLLSASFLTFLVLFSPFPSRPVPSLSPSPPRVGGGAGRAPWGRGGPRRAQGAQEGWRAAYLSPQPELSVAA